jgi:serine/threonine-protein kinase
MANELPGEHLDTKPAVEEPLPRQFGKYTLLRKLAAGGMAELFLALHRSVAGFEKLIVIKRILPSMNTDKAFIDMLLHEARIAATLSHANVVQIFDVGSVDHTYFIAMEHIHGEDIRSIVRAMKKKSVTEFPLEHALAILIGTCAGLAYAHEKRDLDGRLLDIVHRDISPQNIVVTFSGDVKIVDFGIAKSGSQTGEDTKDGQLKGKVPYMSPEQASGEQIDWRSDIFAAGVMLFELTTGKRLFKGASEYETLKLICEKDYPLPSAVRPGYPPALERVVMRALAKKREDRYQSAREMQQDIETFVREERIAVSPVSVSRWMQGLFVEKLAEQKEALQDVKQLADVIAAQQQSTSTLFEGTVPGTAVPSSTSTTAAPLEPQKKGSNTAVWVAVVGLAVLGGAGFFYLKKSQPVPQATGAQTQAQPEVAEAKGSLEITSTPPGAAVWIGGDLRPEVTPMKVEKLPLGAPIQVKLTMEGRESYKETITIAANEPNKQLAVDMKSGSVTVVLKIDPPPTIWLDNKPWKGDRSKIEGLSAGEEHRIVVSASGFQPKTFTFTAQQGETKTFTEALLKADPNAPAPADTSKAAGGPPDKTATPPPPPSGPAKVRVGAKGGFCNVTVNGASVGPTPVEVPVQSGTVRVSCKTADGKTLSSSVTVNPGETGRVGFTITP